MASLIGLHMRSNGIKQIPSRVVFSLNGAGLGGDETHADTITVLRDTRAFPDGEAPPNWRTYDGSDWSVFGDYWYGIHDAYWALNPANYYQITNEQGGGEGPDVEGNYIQLVKVERAIMQAANADGRQCCVLNLAGGSPGDFELWKAICAPFIVEAWESGGNVYGRHVYADRFVTDSGEIEPGQPQRVIDELEHLKSIGYGGGVVLTECGLFGGYGVADYPYFEQQVTRWEQALRPFADILIGFCWWETGASEFDADYTAHIKKLLPYIEAGDLPRWTPPAPPDSGGNDMKIIDSTRADRKSTAVKVGVAFFKTESQGAGKTLRTWIKTVDIADLIPDDTSEISLVQYEDEPDEPTDPNPPPVVSNPLPQGALVVDVSYANDVNLATLKANGVQGVIIRASNGIRLTGSSDAAGVDVRFWQHLEEATALGMPWGSYHYCNENYDDLAQVKHFCSIIQEAIDNSYPPPSLGLWLDFETPDNPIYAGAPTTESRIQALCTALRDLRPLAVDFGVYSSPGWWNGKVPNALTWVPPLGMKQWLAAWVPESKLTDGLYPPSGWNPGNLLGFGDRYRWQFTPAGGYTVGHAIKALDLNYEGAAVPSKPPTPPPGQTVDVLPYFVPGNTHGRYMVMHFDDGRTQPQQLEKRGNMVYLWKGEGWQIDGQTVYDYESWGVDLKKWVDTSDQGNNGRDAYNLNGVVWLPRFVEIGKVYISTPTVTRFDRITCNVISELQTTDYLYAKALYPTWTSPKNTNITLENVLLIEWRKTPDINTPPLESYFLAPDMCYCAWQNAAIGELPQGRQPLSFQLTNCQ